MKRGLARLSSAVAILALLALCVLRFAVLPWYDAENNGVREQSPPNVSDALRDFHDAAFVADLHADALLWKRDLRKRHARGHVDLPRLQQGGVDLQVFGVVTKVPEGANYLSNPADSDALPLLFVAAWRSPGSWFSPRYRALAQAREFSRLAGESTLSPVLRKSDLEKSGVKGLLALEGMHAPGDGAATLRELHAAGFRMIGLAHLFDNAFAGSAHGIDKHGLSAAGRELVAQMETLGITVDLAHASPAAFTDTLAIASNPVVVSHGGVQATCPGPRNLSDEQLRALAANGGVLGVGFWKGAVCETSLRAIVAAILHAVEVAGIGHVGLGSDFDGHVETPFDASGLPALSAALLAAGLSKQEVRKIIGENVKRVLAANLPE